MTNDELDWVPQTCTLPTAEQPLRLAEFDDLFEAAVRTSQRVAPRRLRLTLSGDAGLEASVTDLAARESECCSFFDFTISSAEPGEAVLDIDVPDAHLAVLDALEARVHAARGAP